MARPARIVIGAASLADARASLALAVALARRGAAELVGMLAEDPDWTGVLGAPSRVLSAAGDRVAPPSAEAMGRMMARDARALEAALARAARPALLAWRTERCAGPILPRMRAIAMGGDPVVLGRGRIHRHPGAVLLITPEGGAAAALARGLAVDLGADLIAIAVGASAGGLAARDALARIGRCNLSAVVADPVAGPFRTDGDLARLLDHARCPAVLVRGAPPPTIPCSHDAGDPR